MAVQAWTALSILHGPLEVACNAKSWSAPQAVAAELDTTALCDTWTKRIAGLKSYTWTSELMQDFAVDSIDEETWAALAVADTPCSVLPAGSTSGSKAYLMPTLPLNYTPLSATVGELGMASLGGSGTGPVARGRVMHPNGTARTSSSTGTAYQLGAITATQRMYGALHVTFASGTTPTLVVKLQSSATEGGSYTDRITFTSAGGLTSQWSSVAGAVTDTWWRASWTIGGTGTPTFQFGLTAGKATP